MSESPITPEMADHIASEIKRLLAELAKVNAQSFQQADVLTGICTQLIAQYALLSFFVSAKQTEHMGNLVKHSERLVKLTWAIIILTVGLLFFTVYLYKDTHTLIQHENATKQNSSQ